MSRRVARRTFVSITAFAAAAAARWSHPALAAPGERAAEERDRIPVRPFPLSAVTGQAQPLTLEPLNSIFDERYAVYWKVLGRAAQAGAV
jgi:hypothetical protein